MHIWLVNAAERLSFDEPKGRRMRMGLLCAHLLERDHQVTYWTSAFNHVQKIMRSDTTVVERSGALTLVRLRALGYKRHVSVARLVDHIYVAHRFSKESEIHEVPDLVICSYPTIEMARAATTYGARHDVPVVVDVRDLWPDLFHWRMPVGWRTLGNATIRPYDAIARKALGGATALTAIADGILDWAVVKSGRPRSDQDRVIPFCYEMLNYADEDMKEAGQFWVNLGVPARGRPISLFLGSFSRSLDLRPVIQAARILRDEPESPLFVLCGEGDMTDIYRKEAADLDNVLMPGWVNSCQIRAILERATIAISPMADRPDFKMTINNKFVEYLSGGVPILVSPVDSHCARLATERDCGQGFSLDDPEGLADIIRRVVADEARLGRWRQNARALFNERFTTDRVLREWDDLIESVLRASRHERAVP